MSRERINYPAAIRLNKKTYSHPAIGNHGIVVLMMEDLGIPEETIYAAGEQGYADPHGNFVTREEYAILQEKSGFWKPKNPNRTPVSEDFTETTD